jgi:ABC-type lipoprotein release transport system permease subunit
LSLSLKLLFRKRSTITAITAIALLVAIVASMTAIENFVDQQATTIGQLASVGDRFLLVSHDCSSLIDSRIDAAVANAFNLSDFRYVSTQKLVSSRLETAQGNFSAQLRGISSLSGYFKAQPATVNGSWAQKESEIDVGVLLAKSVGLSKGDYVSLSIGGVSIFAKVVGVATTGSQIDSEILTPLAMAYSLTGDNAPSFVEFSLKSGANKASVINNLSTHLPSDVQIVKVQQTANFLQSTTGEIHNFLTVWSLAVYVLVAVSSYVVCARLVVESEYELAMLKALGARRRGVFGAVFVYAVAAALAGAVLGVSLGIVGTQAASSGLRWLSSSISLTPFLDLAQAGQIIGLSAVFSMLGCLYPALMAWHKRP